MGGNEGYDVFYKILILGNSDVGKSRILSAFSDVDFFKSELVSQIGRNFKIKTIHVGGVKVRLEIWASAGEQRLSSRRSSKEFYGGAKGIIIVYDVTDPRSFDYVPKWLANIEEHADSQVQVMILANKCDLDNRRVVTMEQGLAMATNHGIKFMETSAKNGVNIEKAFHQLANSILIQQTQIQNPPTDPFEVGEVTTTCKCCYL